MVVLRAQLYNPPEALQTCLHYVDQHPWPAPDSDVRSPVRQSDRTPTLQNQTILTDCDIQALIRDYQSGATIKALAKHYRIHRTTVYEHLDRRQIPRRQRGLTQQQIDTAVELYTTGHALATIGQRFKVDPQTVRARLAEAGVQIRKRRGWCTQS